MNITLKFVESPIHKDNVPCWLCEEPNVDLSSCYNLTDPNGEFHHICHHCASLSDDEIRAAILGLAEHLQSLGHFADIERTTQISDPSEIRPVI